MNIAHRAVQDRAMALAVLALLIAAAWAGPVGAYLDLVGSGSEQLLARAALLERYRELVRKPAVAAGQPAATVDLMLPDMPEEQAVALLQERIKSGAAANQVRIDSMQVLRSTSASRAIKIGVRIKAAGDVAGVARLLFAIESAHPVLYPDNLQLQARAGKPAKPPQMLDFQLDVSAFKPSNS